MPFRLIFALLLSSLFCTCVRAQTNWQPGYITSPDGTKQEGEINAVFSEDHFDNIQFRTSVTATVQKIDVADLHSFGTADRSYEVHEVRVNAAPRSVENATLLRDHQTEQGRGALLELLGGDIALLEYRDELGQAHFFLRKLADTLTHLPYAQYLVETADGGRRIRQDKTYLLSLNQIVGDCPGILPKIQRIAYERKAMIKLIRDYASCKDLSLTRQRPAAKDVLSFGLSLGVNRRSFDTGYPTPPTGIFNWGPSIKAITPMVGLDVQYRQSEYARFSVRAITYLAVSNKNRSTTEPSPGSTTNAERRLELSATSLNLHLGASYRIISGKYPIKLEGGLVIGHAFPVKDIRYSTINGFEQHKDVFYPSGITWGRSYGISIDLDRLNIAIRDETHTLRQDINVALVYGPYLMASYRLK